MLTQTGVTREKEQDASLNEIEDFYTQLAMENDLIEAVSLLNELCGSSARVEEYRVGKVCNEVLLVNTETNSVLRVIPKTEVMVIARSLKRLHDLSMH